MVAAVQCCTGVVPVRARPGSLQSSTRQPDWTVGNLGIDLLQHNKWVLT